MKNQIKEALEQDISEMLEYLAESPHWTKDCQSFEYEFMVNKDGELMYEQWNHSPGCEPVDMEGHPLFKRLKDLHYTGVCYVRFHNHGTLISGDVTEDEEYILEVVLTNSSFHTSSPYFLTEGEEGEINIVFMSENHTEDDRYFFVLSKDWTLKKPE